MGSPAKEYRLPRAGNTELARKGMPNAFGLHPVAADDGAAVPVALHGSRRAALLKAPRDLTAAPCRGISSVDEICLSLALSASQLILDV